MVSHLLTNPYEHAQWDLALRPLRLLVETDLPDHQWWARLMLIESLSHTMRFEEASTTASRFIREPAGRFTGEVWAMFIGQLRALRELGRAEEALAPIERFQVPALGRQSAEVFTEVGLLLTGGSCGWILTHITSGLCHRAPRWLACRKSSKRIIRARWCS
jgi:hypothetical protein